MTRADDFMFYVATMGGALLTALKEGGIRNLPGKSLLYAGVKHFPSNSSIRVSLIDGTLTCESPRSKKVFVPPSHVKALTDKRIFMFRRCTSTRGTQSAIIGWAGIAMNQVMFMASTKLRFDGSFPAYLDTGIYNDYLPHILGAESRPKVIT